MKGNKLMWVLIVILIFFCAIMSNLCGIGDMIKDLAGLDDEKDDDEDDEDDEYDDDELDEDDEDDIDSQHCSNVRFSKSTDGIETTWTSIGLTETAYLDATSQLIGGYEYQAYWNWNYLGHMSDPYMSKALLYNHLKTYPSSDIGDDQLWWYSCLLVTGYGGVP